MSVTIGEPLISDYSVHDYRYATDQSECSTALAARVERNRVFEVTSRNWFTSLSDWADSDSLIKLYTGFASYSLHLSFFWVSWTSGVQVKLLGGPKEEKKSETEHWGTLQAGKCPELKKELNANGSSEQKCMLTIVKYLLRQLLDGGKDFISAKTSVSMALVHHMMYRQSFWRSVEDYATFTAFF